MGTKVQLSAHRVLRYCFGMLSRRNLVIGCSFLAAAGGVTRAAAAPARVAPVRIEDGHYTQDWFVQSFLDLSEDLSTAAQAGKRFAIVWQQLYCPYCEEMHKVNFADPEINVFVRTHFDILELDLFGAREVTDFDGTVLPERILARRYGVGATPTIQFFPESVAAMAGRKGRAAEVARMPGYYRPFHFQTMFEFVAQHGYDKMPFPRYVQARIDQLKAAGETRDW